jgi:hypothetical protein
VLDPSEAGRPTEHEGRLPTQHHRRRGIVAVASGLVQVGVAGRTPALPRGQVLVADCERVEGWRIIGETEAVLFWIVVAPEAALRPRIE